MNKLFKTLTLLAICFVGIQQVNAQEISFGVKGGADFSKWGGDDVENADLNTNIGFHIGAFAEMPLTNALNLESGLYVSRKGFKADDQILGVNMDVTNTSTYLDIPVLAKYAVTKNYYIALGPQASFLLNNKLTMEIAGEKDTDKGVSGFNKFDLGAVAGMGYQFNNGLLVSANYDFGLRSLDDVTNTKAYNRVIKASVGYRFN